MSYPRPTGHTPVLLVTYPFYCSHTRPTGHTPVLLVVHPSYWSYTRPTAHKPVQLVTHSSYFSHTRPTSRRHIPLITNPFFAQHPSYWNSLPFNVDDKYMKQLQRVQNSLARVVCKTSKFCHITPVLHSLDWLKIKYRIVFKINTLVYKTLHTDQLVYLRELFSLSEKQRTRASGTRELIRPRSPETEAGSDAFSCCCCFGIPFLQKYKQLRRIPSSTKY